MEKQNMMNQVTAAHGVEEGLDGREFERYEIDVPVEVQFITPGGMKNKMLLQAANLSAGGALFKTLPSLPEGTELKLGVFLMFKDPDDPYDAGRIVVISVTGYVQRSGPEGTAVCFMQDYEIRGLPAQ
jgi:hypothetical protein